VNSVNTFLTPPKEHLQLCLPILTMMINMPLLPQPSLSPDIEVAVATHAESIELQSHPTREADFEKPFSKHHPI
jgi:hypothetical protein